MNDKTKPAAAITGSAEQIEAKTKLFAVTKAFWLGDRLCSEGEQVQLTDSQAKRAGQAVEPAKAAPTL